MGFEGKGTFASFIRRATIAGAVISFAISSYAAEGNSGGNGKPPATYTFNGEQIVEMIRSVKSGDLQAAKLNVDGVLNLTDRKPYQQVIEALVKRLEDEIAKGNFDASLAPGEELKGMDIHLVEYLFDAICAIAPGAEYANRLASLMETVANVADSEPETKAAFDKNQFGEKFEVHLKQCQHNNSRLIALPGIEANGTPTKALDDELKAFRAHLETEIKGQPEVIDALVAIRQKDLVYGYRTHSPSIWLLGLPGVGKDTSARGYTNAMNNDANAWKTHMYTISPLVGKEDLWSILGSGTGYVGSDNFPPFLEFLVNHSGGRYSKVKAETGPGEKPKWKVIENEGWRPGDQYDFAPERAVLYLDEFHKWSKDIKDLFIKKALESDGTFRIYNPNEGLDKISVPVTIVIGSNDGISLLASREKNGERFGDPLTYEQMLEKQQRVSRDENAISGAILGGGGATGGGEISKGTSEELLNRVKTVIVMRPLSPEQLREIAEHKLRLMIEGLANTTGGYDQVKIEYTPEVVKFIQEFHYIAEDNARPIDKRIETLFQEPLFEAMRNGSIKRGEKVTVLFNVRKEADRTYTGLIEFPGSTPSRPTTTVPIRATEIERAKRPPTDEELAVLDLLPEQLKGRVVGQDDALERIAAQIKVTESKKNAVGTTGETKAKARVFMAMGYSSVGKTETVKAIARYVTGDESNLVTIQFSEQMTEKELNEAIFGTKDYAGNAIPSKFMQNYDRTGGRLVVSLDEGANAPRVLLNKLYDMFREPVVTTFSDGRPRSMANIIFVMSGNAGQELHKELPSYLPESVRREAMQDVHRKLIGDPNMQRQIYEQYFSAPLLARIGEKNIFNYGPLDYLSAGKLVQIKIATSLKALLPKEGQRGWNVVFKDDAAYKHIVDAMESEGFSSREQGASIDHFVGQEFQEALDKQLLDRLVPDGAEVVVDFGGVEIATEDHDVSADHDGVLRNKLTLKITAGDKAFDLVLEGIQRTPDVPKMKREMILTAYHEAGHSLVRAALMGEYYTPGSVKVIPGVAHIAGRWVYYAGLATAHSTLRMDTTREFLVRELAVLFGGAVAEDLIVQGGYSSHGKQNDMQRATAMAQKAILDLGLEPGWGLRNAKLEELSEADRNKLNGLVEGLLTEGRALASEAIRANYKIFETVGNGLAKTGELTGKQIKDIYEAGKILTEGDTGYEAAAKASPLQEQEAGARRGLGYKMVTSLSFIAENEIVDLERDLAQKRQAQIDQLTTPANTPFAKAGSAPKPPAPVAKPAADKASKARGPGGTQTPTGKCDTLLDGDAA